MSKKKKFWLIVSVVAIVTPILIFFAYSWVWDRLELVERGLASPEFPYTKYSQQKLEEMYPSHEDNANAPTTRTPEETHKMFVEKLKEGDLDGAVECCFVKDKQEEMKLGLQRVKDGDKLELMISDISVVEQEMMLDTIATYFYVGEIDGKKYANTMEFIKNSEGVWLIESL